MGNFEEIKEIAKETVKTGAQVAISMALSELGLTPVLILASGAHHVANRIQTIAKGRALSTNPLEMANHKALER